MRIVLPLHAAVLVALICAPSLGHGLQSTVNAPPSQTTPVVAATPSGPTASSLLSPSLDGLEKTTNGLNLEKWKKGNVREEAGTNIQSIQRDLQSSLPGLLSTADAAPGSVSKSLPVSRNLDALYAVLLRVVDAARIAAPDDQFNQLQSAMANLNQGRQALNDHLQEIAANREKQVADLQIALKTQPVPVCPVAPVPSPTPTPTKKVVKKKPTVKPVQKPAAPAASTPSGSATKPAQ